MSNNFPNSFKELMENSVSDSLPDEIIVMPTESFIKEIVTQLENTPFVALNLTRSVVLRPVEGEAGHTTVTVVAVGFEPEEINNLPDFMHMLTGKPQMVVTAESEEVREVIETSIKQETVDSSFSIPKAEEDNSGVMEF